MIPGRLIRKIIAGEQVDYGSLNRITRTGRYALVDPDSKTVLGFAELKSVEPMPFTEYQQFYGKRLHHWEVDNDHDPRQKAYRYTFENASAMANPKRIFFGQMEKFVVYIDDFFLGNVQKQKTLTDFF